jgi:precorrin-4/cobalt-precorrin-4 C11-methyltransferase
VPDGRVYFIGAGPGDPELLTLRASRVLREADVILYADSLVSPVITQFAKPGATVQGTSGLHLEAIVAKMVAAVRAGQIVARVHSGDPTVYGAIHEQMVRLREAGVSYEIIPGVSSVFAAAARLGVECTVPEVVQTLILARCAGRTPMPEKENLRNLAAHQATLGLFLSASHLEEVVAELTAGGYPANTYQASGVKRANGCTTRSGVGIRETNGEAAGPSAGS